jgi:hypothetical protein
LRKGEMMTPEKSAEAALDWMREKSLLRSGDGTISTGLKNYNRSPDDHAKRDRLKYGDDYHPGVPHYEWYAQKILRLESEMLKSLQR